LKYQFLIKKWKLGILVVLILFTVIYFLEQQRCRKHFHCFRIILFLHDISENTFNTDNLNDAA